MKIIRKAGDTSNILQIFIQDSSSTTGAGLTGLTSGSSGLTAYYHKDTDTTATAISLVTMTVGTFTSSGFKEIDSTNMPGWYQFCPPDAALSTSGSPKSVGIHLKGATNMAPLPIEIQLVSIDLQDTVRMGLTAMPNVASGSAGAIITSGTGTAQLSVASGLVTLAASQPGVTIPTVTTVTNQLTAAAIATGVWQDTTSGDFTVSSSIGKSLYTSGNAPGAASGLALVGSNMGTITGALTGAQIATAVWTDTTAGDFTTALSIGKSIMNGVSLGTGLTINAYTGNTPQTGDAYARLGAPAGASTSADIAAVKTDTAAVKLQTDKMAFTVSNQIDANPLSINGSATAASNLAKSAADMGRGTCTTGGSTTSVPTSAFTPGGASIVSGQFIGRTIIFDGNTTTGALQGQATNITANTSGATPTFTVTALTTAPVSGDTFSVV